ncbi:hypothetical protein [Photorhabdus bodei]|uniref:helix-turn-helix domain-containing transcriptional regulator n=1 Tax=Photorhabdus bodei TaxID=2029681 RepID=UPI00308383AA
MQLYLEEVMKEDNPALILSALGDIAKARNISQLVKEVGIATRAYSFKQKTAPYSLPLKDKVLRRPLIIESNKFFPSNQNKIEKTQRYYD